MALAVGTRLGPYEIVAPIGAGGMGEVYRARDTNLDRDVAIKVLPSALAQDPERLARFEREAKVLAALNHPNIAQIYGVEQGALVMELVEGEMLSGPLPLATVLDHARQIADALEAAHEKGIVHRDLKPANVKVTPQGVVKVLDFGLAAVAQPTSSRADASISPTLTLAATQIGVLLGTANYMSPEQAAGKPLDKRADIWSFGVVVWELLTGRRLFDGETVSHTLAAVLTKDVDWAHLPSATPAGLRKLLRRCLERDLRRRLPDIGSARLELEEAMAHPGAETPLPDGRPHSVKLLAVLASLFGLAFFAVTALYWRATKQVNQPVMRLSVDLGPNALTGFSTTAVISPDGTRLIFPVRGSDGRPMLATRLLGQLTSSALRGTENGADPFFSPDGQWIGFFADGKLKKISVQGGAAIPLCDAPNPRGASWSEDGSIIFAPTTSTGLSRVSAAGGTPQRLANLAGSGQVTHRWPQVLPGGSAVLFTGSSKSVGFEGATITALSLGTGEVKTLIQGGYFGRFIPTERQIGELVYISQGVLFGVPFDPVKLQVRGAPVPLAEDVAANPSTGSGQFDFSRTGILVYQTGKAVAQSWPLVWMENSGNFQPLLLKAGLYTSPRVSPDGLRVAITVGTEGADVDVFVYDWQRDTTSRLTFNKRDNFYPTWSPDGKHITVRSRTISGGSEIVWLRADGAGEPQRLLETKNLSLPYSFSPDGHRLAYAEQFPDTGTDLWTLPLDLGDQDHPKAGKPELFLRTPANELFPAFSPDGHWIAYSSDESGQMEIYVRPFPGPGGKWQISSSGGQFPIWSRNGRELFFEAADNRIMVTEYAAKNNTFVSDKPRLWSDKQILSVGSVKNLDLAPDGKRFVVFPLPDVKEEQHGNVHVTFLLNFFDELRRRNPETK